jgi:hypothetical protein
MAARGDGKPHDQVFINIRIKPRQDYGAANAKLFVLGAKSNKSAPDA